MKLTGKCKDDFEKWIENRWMDSGLIHVSFAHQLLFDVSTHLYLLPFEMQYGVYVDFFDSVGLIVEAQRCLSGYKYYVTPIPQWFDTFNSKTRQEAREQAIIKANEIYNLKQ